MLASDADRGFEMRVDASPGVERTLVLEANRGTLDAGDAPTEKSDGSELQRLMASTGRGRTLEGRRHRLEARLGGRHVHPLAEGCLELARPMGTDGTRVSAP